MLQLRIAGLRGCQVPRTEDPGLIHRQRRQGSERLRRRAEPQNSRSFFCGAMDDLGSEHHEQVTSPLVQPLGHMMARPTGGPPLKLQLACAHGCAQGCSRGHDDIANSLVSDFPHRPKSKTIIVPTVLSSATHVGSREVSFITADKLVTAKPNPGMQCYSNLIYASLSQSMLV